MNVDEKGMLLARRSGMINWIPLVIFRKRQRVREISFFFFFSNSRNDEVCDHEYTSTNHLKLTLSHPTNNEVTSTQSANRSTDRSKLFPASFSNPVNRWPVLFLPQFWFYNDKCQSKRGNFSSFSNENDSSSSLLLLLFLLISFYCSSREGRIEGWEMKSNGEIHYTDTR